MTTIETRETHDNIDLLTRWYQNDYDTCKEAVLSIAKKMGYVVGDHNDEFGEILLEKSDFVNIVNISSITPLKTSINFCVSTKGLFKKPNTQVILFYNDLNKLLKFLAKGRM